MTESVKVHRKDQSVKDFTSECLLSIKWNSIRLGGPAHGIVIKTVHKTLPGGGGGPGGGG